MRRPFVAGRAAVALVAALSVAVSPTLPLVHAQTPAPASSPPPAAAAKPAAAAARLAAPASRPRRRPDGGWPRAYSTPSGGKIVVYQPQVASWDDQRHVVAYAAVSYAAKGATKPALGSVKIEADTKVAVVGAARQLQRLQDHGVQLPDAAQGADARGGGRDRQGDPRRGPRDRPRPRAGQRRPQPDHPEERRGREGGPADDLLQQEAGDAREHRRRPDLEPDQGERPEVRRQHQLGPLPARPDEGLLPAQRAELAPGRGPEGPVDRGGQAARRASRSSRPTTTGRTSSAALPGKKLDAGQAAAGLRQHRRRPR